MLTFRFVDPAINSTLVEELRKRKISFHLDDQGVIHYSQDDVSDVINFVRDVSFPEKWQIVSFPQEWAESYRKYVIRHGFRCIEEMDNGELCLLVSRIHHPDTWEVTASCLDH